MADPAKFKSVSVSMPTYKILKYLSAGKVTEADLTISKTIELLAKISAELRPELCRYQWADCDTCDSEGEIVVEKHYLI